MERERESGGRKKLEKRVKRKVRMRSEDRGKEVREVRKDEERV